MIVERFRQEGDLPEGWVEAVLEDLIVHALGGEWGRGNEVAQDPDYVPVRVLRGLEFRDWNRERGATAAVRWVRRPSLAKRQLRAGDIVVEISGGGTDQPVGRTVLIDEATLSAAPGPLICSNFCRQIRVHPEVDPAYVQLALRYQYHCGGFDEYQTQTTNIRNLSFSDFLRVSLPLPPLAEQQRIVERTLEILARVERTREGLARVPPLLRRFRQSTLAAAGSGLLTEDWRAGSPVITTGPESMSEVLGRVFSQRREEWSEVARLAAEAGVRPPRRPANLDPTEYSAPAPLELPEIPVGWEMVPLGDLVMRAQYGTSVKATARAKGGVPILRMGNIQNGEIDTSSLKYVEATLENLESFVLQPGDILFNRTNSPELVGKAAVWDRETRAVFASYLVRLTCDPRLILSPYLCAWINSPWGRWWARTVRTDCVSQSNINASKLLAMPVPLPPLAEQVEIVRRMAELFQYADAIETRVAGAISRSDKLERMVLAKALRGELVPTEAELASFDGRSLETGGVLLERVQGQRSHAGRRLRTRLRRKKAEAREEPPAPRATVLAARPAGNAPPGTGGVALEDYSPERILMAFRQACWGARVLSRDDLLRGVAYRLGFARLGQRIRTGLETHLRTAVARRIVAPSADGSDGFYAATPKFGRYDYDFLLGTLRVVMRKNADYEPEAVMRAVAAWLGFGNVTEAMRERMNEVLEVAVRRGLLAAVDGRLRRRI